MAILQTTKSEETSEAIYLRKNLEDFEVVVIVVMQNKILTTVHIVSKLLQSQKQDLGKVYALLKDAYEDLKLYQNDFKSVVQTATDTAKSWGIKPEFQKKNKCSYIQMMNYFMLQLTQQMPTLMISPKI
jgi:hypothetical protein